MDAAAETAQNEKEMNPTTDQLHRAILQAFEDEARRIIDEEAKAAGKRVEDRVRGLAGDIAARVSTWVNYRAGMDELTITVKLPERKP